MVLTPYQLHEIDSTYLLAGYPKSHFFTVGYDLWKAKQDDAALDAFKRGAENDGCVPCMVFYIYAQWKRDNFHLLLPYVIEAAVRGHAGCIDELVDCYQKAEPVTANALAGFWAKLRIDMGSKFVTEEKRKEIKKNIAKFCRVCGKEESEENNDVTLVKCGICKFYSYCGKYCQTRHWKEGKHMNECRQVILLRKYCKPSYVKEIREAIINGQDPKEIHTLQRLRMKLGLNRPKEEYEDFLLSFANDDDNNTNNSNNKKINAIERGTKVKVKGLAKATQHNGKFGIVTKVSSSEEAGGSRRVGVKLLDDDGTVLSIKINNLELSALTTSSKKTTNRPNPLEYLTARKDGTVHIGSTPNTI